MSPPPSMPLILAILYTVSRWIQGPLIIRDLIRMVQAGALPYFQAHAALPSDIRQVLLKCSSHGLAFFTPQVTPSVASLQVLALDFYSMVTASHPSVQGSLPSSLQPPPRLPPLHASLVLTRVAAALRLPPSVAQTARGLLFFVDARDSRNTRKNSSRSGHSSGSREGSDMQQDAGQAPRGQHKPGLLPDLPGLPGLRLVDGRNSDDEAIIRIRQIIQPFIS